MWTERNHRMEINIFPSHFHPQMSLNFLVSYFLGLLFPVLCSSPSLAVSLRFHLPSSAFEGLSVTGAEEVHSLTFPQAKIALNFKGKKQTKNHKGFISPSHTPLPSLHHFLCVKYQSSMTVKWLYLI